MTRFTNFDNIPVHLCLRSPRYASTLPGGTYESGDAFNVQTCTLWRMTIKDTGQHVYGTKAHMQQMMGYKYKIPKSATNPHGSWKDLYDPVSLGTYLDYDWRKLSAEDRLAVCKDRETAAEERNRFCKELDKNRLADIESAQGDNR